MAQKVGILTAGGLAPCLSSALGYLLEIYTETDASIEVRAFSCTHVAHGHALRTSARSQPSSQ